MLKNYYIYKILNINNYQYSFMFNIKYFFFHFSNYKLISSVNCHNNEKEDANYLVPKTLNIFADTLKEL